MTGGVIGRFAVALNKFTNIKNTDRLAFDGGLELSRGDQGVGGRRVGDRECTGE